MRSIRHTWSVPQESIKLILFPLFNYAQQVHFLNIHKNIVYYLSQNEIYYAGLCNGQHFKVLSINLLVQIPHGFYFQLSHKVFMTNGIPLFHMLQDESQSIFHLGATWMEIFPCFSRRLFMIFALPTFTFCGHRSNLQCSSYEI